MKTSRLFLNTKVDEKNFMYIKDMMTEKTSLIFFTIAIIFNLANVAQLCMNYAERCFTMIAENNNFLQLDFALLKKILQSSKLHITSELEVFYAANNWISYNIEERSKFAKDALLTVRLPLLSEPALKYLLNKTAKILQTNECKKIIESVVEKRDNFFNKLSRNSFQTRYCEQTQFEILLCEYYQDILKLKQVNGKDLLENNSMIVKTYGSTKNITCRAVCVNSDIYLFVTDVTNNTLAVVKHSIVSKVWEDVTKLNFRWNFCVCSLVGKIYTIGGKDSSENFSSCMQYDTKNGEIKDIFEMNMQRFVAAGTIYKGNIVVSGGFVQNYRPTNTVEVYYHIANSWSYMPNTVYEKYNHSLVAMRSKLFVIGHSNYPYEVYDSTTNKFSIIESSTNLRASVTDKVGAVSIGNKIVIFGSKESTVMFYDTDKDEWCEKSGDFFKGRKCLSCIRIPEIQF